MRIYLASFICSLAITRFFFTAAIPIQREGPPAPENPQVDKLPEWVKATVIIPGAFMPHEDDNSPNIVEMYIPHDDDIPAVVSVVNILRLMQSSATGRPPLTQSFRNFVALLRKVLISLPGKAKWSRRIRKDNDDDVWRGELHQHVKNHNKKIWYNPAGSEGVEQEVQNGLKSMRQPINEVIKSGDNWGQGSMKLPKVLTPTGIKERINIRIPVDADIPGIASLLNIVHFMRQKVPVNSSTPALESFVWRMTMKLRFLPKIQHVTREPVANEDWKDSLVEIVKNHNKRIWYRPGGWENLEERVREALESGVPERKPKQNRRKHPLPARRADPNLSTEAKFPTQSTSPMHQHPGLNVDPKDQMHAHDSTLDPHAHFHPGSNSFDFNAPLSHSSPNPMVATAVNQGFQVPSFSYSHFLHPYDNWDIDPQLMDLSHYAPYDYYNHPSGSEGYSQQQSSVEVSSLGLPHGSHSSLSPSSEVVAGSPHHVMHYPSPPPPQTRWK